MCDVFCLLDNVQFSKKDYIHRNRIKSPDGPVWLTVPMHTHNHQEKTIRDMYIDNSQKWNRSHWNNIVGAYGKKAPFFHSYNDFFEDIYKKKWEKIVDLDECILTYLFKELGISVNMLKSSEHYFEGKKSNFVLDMCIKLGADMYIFGEMGEAYAEVEQFEQNGIKLHFQNYNHPVYPQLYGDFVSHLSVLDLLFCFGEKSYDILTGQNPKREDLIKKFAV